MGHERDGRRTSNAAVGVGVPGVECAAAGAFKLHDGIVGMVAFAWWVDGCDVYFQFNESECFARVDGLALLGFGWPRAVEVEVVEVRVVEEADDAHPRAGDSVRVESGEIRVGWCAEWSGEGLGDVAVGGETVEGSVEDGSAGAAEGAASGGGGAIEVATEASRANVWRGEVAASAFGIHSDVVENHEHDGLDLFPVDSATAVICKGAPVVGPLVAAEVVDAGAGIRVDVLDAFERGACDDGPSAGEAEWFNFHATEDMEFGGELPKRRSGRWSICGEASRCK